MTKKGNIRLIAAERPDDDRKFSFIRDEFIECRPCRSKPGSPTLCIECLERRELFGLLKKKKKA